MKITKAKLKQIIQEELASLSEDDEYGDMGHFARESDPRGTTEPLNTGAVTFEQWRLEVLGQLPYLHDYWEGKFGQDSTPGGYVEWLTTPPAADSPYHPDSPDYKG